MKDNTKFWMNHYYKWIFSLMLFIVFTTNVQGQSNTSDYTILNFQGTLLDTNQYPITDSLDLSFTLNGWSEVHPDVSIFKGYYTVVLGSIHPLPDSLFCNAQEFLLNIYIEGNFFESVEIQKSSIGDLNCYETSDFQVGSTDTSSTVSVMQGNGTGTAIPQDTVWQSFTAIETSIMTIVKLDFANSYNTDIQLNIREGKGNLGNIIYSKIYPDTLFDSSFMEQAFVIESPHQPQIIGSFEYTLEFIGISNDILVSNSPNNPYPQGETNLGANIDTKFSIHVDVIQPVILKTTPDRKTGINTDQPGAALHVNTLEYTSNGYILLLTNGRGDTLMAIRNDGEITTKVDLIAVQADIGTQYWYPTALNQTMVIAHNLGRIPSVIEVNWRTNNGNYDSNGNGLYTNGKYATVYNYHVNANGFSSNSGISTDYLMYLRSRLSSNPHYKILISDVNENTFTLKVDYYYSATAFHFNWKVIK